MDVYWSAPALTGEARISAGILKSFAAAPRIRAAVFGKPVRLL
jgi:hypothetical protein